MAANGGRYDPFPVDQAIAYVVEILPAFSYLHDLGLLYCDFKPDNIIQVGDAVKLIDLGGVRRIDDDDSPIYGTVGYQAPEVADGRPLGGLRHLHRRPHAGRADLRVPRLPDDVRDVAAAGRRGAAVPAATTRSTGCWQGLRRRPGRPVPDRRRDARPARSACCARSWPPTRPGRGRPAAPRAVRAVRDAGRRRRRPLDWRDLPGSRSTPATRWPPGWPASSVTEPGRPDGRARQRPERAARGAARPGARRRSRAGRPHVADGAITDGARATTRGSGAPSGCRGSRRCCDDAGRRASRVQRRLRAGARRAGAQAGAGPGLRAGRRARRRPAAVRASARAPTRPTSRPPRSAWRASAAAAGRRGRGASRRWTSCRRRAGPTSRRAASAPGCSPRRTRGLPALADAMGSIESVTHRPARPCPAATGVLDAALDAVAEARPAETIGSPGCRPSSRGCATRSSGATASRGAHRRPRASGSRWSTPPTQCAAGRLR